MTANGLITIAQAQLEAGRPYLTDVARALPVDFVTH
jgi:hypothetical protein